MNYYNMDIKLIGSKHISDGNVFGTVGNSLR